MAVIGIQLAFTDLSRAVKDGKIWLTALLRLVVLPLLALFVMVDYPGKLAATIFTGGCNLRCPFCHNALLVTRVDENETLELSDILDFLRSRRGLLDGVVISGGEPLLQSGVDSLAAQIKELGFAVKLDTNGCYPDRLGDLLDRGLVDYVAMDIKNCLPKYPM